MPVQILSYLTQTDLVVLDETWWRCAHLPGKEGCERVMVAKVFFQIELCKVGGCLVLSVRGGFFFAVLGKSSLHEVKKNVKLESQKKESK